MSITKIEIKVYRIRFDQTQSFSTLFSMTHLLMHLWFWRENCWNTSFDAYKSFQPPLIIGGFLSSKNMTHPTNKKQEWYIYKLTYFNNNVSMAFIEEKMVNIKKKNTLQSC